LAVSLPVVIGVWELLFRPPQPRWAPLLRWQYGELLPVWITAIMTAAFIRGRVMGQGGLSGMSGYALASTPAAYLRNTGHFLNELFYADGFFDAPRTLAFLLLLLAVAALARSKELAVCWVIYFVGVLPVAFVEGRGLAAAWLPVTGLLVYAAILAVSLRDLLSKRLRRASRWAAGQVALFAIAAVFTLRVHSDNTAGYEAWKAEYTSIREVRESFRKLCPAMKPRSTVLIVTDPLNGTFSTVFLIHLLYRDSSLIINQLFRFNKPPGRAELAGYSYLFDFVDGELVRLDPAQYAATR
jgi:hypothetical protein